VSSSSRSNSKASSKKEAPVKLSQEEVVEAREAFDLIDQAHEGAVPVSELPVALRALGVVDATSAEIAAALPKKLVGSGVCPFDQFLALVAVLRERRSADSELGAAFRLFDRRHTGRITVNELRTIVAELNESFSEQDLLEMIAEADSTGSGGVSLADFLAIMREAKQAPAK
jgi:Ca2+-binding EF-hand superfamily protein